MIKTRYNERNIVKGYIEILCLALLTEIVRIVLQNALDKVIRAICNAALNACKE